MGENRTANQKIGKFWLAIWQTPIFKGRLMQFWKSLYMIVFIQKQTFENFAFSILRILKLFSRETYKFFKK